MKAWIVVLPIIVAAPDGAVAQATIGEDARAAQLACQLAQLCGDLAQEEALRTKEAIDGVETRGLPSMGALKAAKARSATRPEVPVKAQMGRSIPRSIPASAGRRDSAALRTIESPAAEVPAVLASRAALFVTFGLNSARLTAESKSEVRSFAKALRDIAAAGQNKRFRIEGHTDDTGDSNFNRTLSEQRAAAVRSALLEAGADVSVIEVAGLGSDQPIEGYDRASPLNRRVEAVEIK